MTWRSLLPPNASLSSRLTLARQGTRQDFFACRTSPQVPGRVADAVPALVQYKRVRRVSRWEGRPMPNIQCPTCGREIAPGAACSGCDHTAGNGAAGGLTPLPPAEVASWTI